ncbi:hypothetical protein HZH66_011648 [Vespula vulgaris]|uniref:Uncharacterized protein n=1 Tax=Vespula vulgaris TaxID=7454 RepID=A0A834JC60_VESVU|nr:hypothetical protein HZH66_011648 [Vespula vulgaris]
MKKQPRNVTRAYIDEWKKSRVRGRDREFGGRAEASLLEEVVEVTDRFEGSREEFGDGKGSFGDGGK